MSVEAASILHGQLTPPTTDWRIWIAPIGLIVGFGGWWLILWYYRMRVRGKRMLKVAAAVGSTAHLGVDERTTRAIPHFEGTQLRHARSAYNTVSFTRHINGQAVPFWIGDCSEQFLRDGVNEAIGGGWMESFIAAPSTHPVLRNVMIIDQRLKAEQRRVRIRHRGGDAAIAIAIEALLEYANLRGMKRIRTGDAAFDADFTLMADLPGAVLNVLPGEALPLIMEHRPGHIWILDGAVLILGGWVWTASECLAYAEWLAEFLRCIDAGESLPSRTG